MLISLEYPMILSPVLLKCCSSAAQVLLNTSASAFLDSAISSRMSTSEDMADLEQVLFLLKPFEM
jgi:hypothetical protein